MGPVRLTVADSARARAFYAARWGSPTSRPRAGSPAWGRSAGPALVELEAARGPAAAPPPAPGSSTWPCWCRDRAELARALRRVIEAGASFTGASDHLVSEALYLDDPEGNGIEIYRDRPREEWDATGGELAMATLPLDVEGVLARAAAGDAATRACRPATRMGHVHLQVRDSPAAEAFYAGALGFDPTVRGYPGALFVSAGGYHHHLGLNTWGTARARRRRRRAPAAWAGPRSWCPNRASSTGSRRAWPTPATRPSGARRGCPPATRPVIVWWCAFDLADRRLRGWPPCSGGRSR